MTQIENKNTQTISGKKRLGLFSKTFHISFNHSQLEKYKKPKGKILTRCVSNLSENITTTTETMTYPWINVLIN